MIKFDRAMQISLTIAVLFFSFSFFFYLVIFIPKQAELKVKEKRKQEAYEAGEKYRKEIRESNKEIAMVAEKELGRKERYEKEAALSECVAKAERDFGMDLVYSCRLAGKKDYCNLPADHVEGLTEIKRSAVEKCRLLYK